jgi:hypothetical protein
MNRILSYAEAQSRVGLANDSIAFTVEELQDFITQVQADNLRIYFYKSNPAGRTNFIMSGYTEGVEGNQVFFGDIEEQTVPTIIIEDTDTVFNP